MNISDLLLNAEARRPSSTAHITKVSGSFVHLSYADLVDRVWKVASGLRKRGIGAGDTVAIFAESGTEWATVDWAALSLGAVSVPIYPTLMPETIEYILNDSGATLVFVGDKKLASKLGTVESRVSVVMLEGSGDDTFESLLNTPTAEGSKEDWIGAARAVSPDALATIIYTSGTTGEPKGAELTHEAFTFQCESTRKSLPVDHMDRFFCMLPLSHVYGRLADHFLPISVGAETVFAESLKTLAHDIQQTSPTIVPAVPRFLESVKSKILSTMDDAPWLNRWLFEKAVRDGRARLQRNLAPAFPFGSILDSLVGKKIRAKFGSKVRFFVSGGAALPKDVAEFYAAFGLKILQGYGLTETAPIISINHPQRNIPASVGEVLDGVQVRIADDGEVLMLGKNLMRGYHNKPGDTAAAIDSDGWFHTGDIGRLEGRRLYITDRKKDIIVLSNGKNVAPSMIESRLKASKFIDEAMVIGDGMNHCAALIVPAFEALRHYCRDKGLGTSHQGEMVELSVAQALIKGEVESVNKSLADFEKVKAYRVMKEPWTQETGELTPSLKVRRPYIREKFAEDVAVLTKS